LTFPSPATGDDDDDDDDYGDDGDAEREVRAEDSPRRLVQASSARLLRLTERVTAVALRSISAPDGANVGAAAADIAPDRWGGGSGQGAAAARAAALATYAGVGGTTAGDDFKMNYADDSDDAEDDRRRRRRRRRRLAGAARAGHRHRVLADDEGSVSGDRRARETR
jgi:hypothetical protein